MRLYAFLLLMLALPLSAQQWDSVTGRGGTGGGTASFPTTAGVVCNTSASAALTCTYTDLENTEATDPRASRFSFHWSTDSSTPAAPSTAEYTMTPCAGSTSTSVTGICVNPASGGAYQIGEKTNTLSTTTGGLSSGVKKVNYNYTISIADHTILCDASPGPITITLPAIDTQEVFVKKIDSTTNACTVTSPGPNIDAATTSALSARYASVLIQGDGTQWWIF